MLATSALIPPAATAHWVRGLWRHRTVPPWSPGGRPVAAVLFDRDGTLVHDVPYNGRPELVRPVDGARPAIAGLRAAGIKVGVVTNQSGVARGLIRRDDVDAVNARVDALLGPFDTWQVCPHDDADACACRKPQPGMVLAAAAALGVPPEQCVVIGDTAADLGAAGAAGARAILVPNAATRPEEVLAAAWTAADLIEAVAAVLESGTLPTGARVPAGVAG
jgi:histidinol-phosphate phosphatase family protein